MSTLPEPEGWLANAILQCLNDWKEAAKPQPLIITDADFKQLKSWVNNLYQSWLDTDKSLKQNRIPVTQYPVKIQ